MDEMKALLDLDLTTVTLGIVGILVVLVLILSKIDFLKNFFGIKTKSDVEHELLVQTSQNLDSLQNQHVKDMEEFRNRQAENVAQSIKHDERIRDDLQAFMTEVRDAIKQLNNHLTIYVIHPIRPVVNPILQFIFQGGARVFFREILCYNNKNRALDRRREPHVRADPAAP